MAGAINFNVIQGDTFLKNVTFRNKATKVPVDLTDSTVSGIVSLKSGSTVDLTATITNASAGQFSFGLSAAETEELPTGVHKIEVQIVYSDSTVKTLLSGNLVVTAQLAP